MTIRKRTIAAVVLVLAVCSSLAAEPVSGRFGAGYVFLGADGEQRSFPGNEIELRILPLTVFGKVLLGTDIRLAEDLWFAWGQFGDVAASIRLVAVVPSSGTARLSFFAGPRVDASMDPAYGSVLELGGLIGTGAEVFLAPPFSVGFDVGFSATSMGGAVRMLFFADLVARLYFS